MKKGLKEMGTSWEGVKSRLSIDWGGRGACVVVLASGSLVQR